MPQHISQSVVQSATRSTAQSLPQPRFVPASVEVPTEDLPLWMRQARRRTDWGLILVLLLSLSLSWSFLTRPGINPAGTGLNYGFMASDIADSLREGRLYPRWSPHAFAGYGAPVLNYYPPGAAYLVALIEVLFTDDTLTALRLVYALAPLLGGSLMYAFISRRCSAPEGVLAALLYVFSPYVGLVAPQILGDLPGVLMLALLPGLLWSVSRLLMLNHPLDFTIVVCFTAALLFIRPSGLLAGVALVALLLILHLWDGKYRWRILLVLLAITLGVSLVAMYWLPALLELNAIHWLKPEFPAIPHLLTLTDLLAPLRQPDPGELAPAAQFTPGWVLLAFAVAGLTGSLVALNSSRQRQRNLHLPYRYQLTFLIAGLALTAAALRLTPAATELTGVITLCLAVGGSAALAWRSHLPAFWQRIGFILALALALIGSLNVWLNPLLDQVAPGFQPVNQIQYEQQQSGIAVLPPDASIPTTLEANLSPDRTLVSSYQGVLQKVMPAQLTRNGQIGILSQESHDAHYQIRIGDITALSCRTNQPSSPNCRRTSPVTMTWLTAYFPGWQAWLNDLQLNIQRNPQTGLIEIRLPGTQSAGGSQTSGGEAELVISLGATPVRTAAWAVSWSAGLITLLILWLRSRQADHRQYYDNRRLLTPAEARLTAVLVISFGVVFALTVPARAPLSLRTRPGTAFQNLEHYEVQTEVGLQLFGYQFDHTDHVYRPGDTMQVALYWRALRPLPDNYRVRLYLQDVNRLVNHLEQPLRDPGGYPTRHWTSSGYIKDVYQLPLPADLFTGNYRITLEVFACDRLVECNRVNRLTFFESQSDPTTTLRSIPEQTLQLPAVIKITS